MWRDLYLSCSDIYSRPGTCTNIILALTQTHARTQRKESHIFGGWTKSFIFSVWCRGFVAAPRSESHWGWCRQGSTSYTARWDHLSLSHPWEQHEHLPHSGLHVEKHVRRKRVMQSEITAALTRSAVTHSSCLMHVVWLQDALTRHVAHTTAVS